MGKTEERINIPLESNALEEMAKLSKSMDALIGKTEQLEESMRDGFDQVEKSARGAGASMKLMAFNAVNESIQLLSEPFKAGSQAVMDYDHSLKELQAITGVTDDTLNRIGSSARESSKEFGLAATDQLKSYQIILSKLGPDLASQPEALASMGRSVSVLSKTMGGDAVGAVRALTSSMNQYGVSLDDPAAASEVMATMMNNIAAAAQVGSVEVPQIGQALEASGAIAKKAGLSFAETNAAIQVLGKFGKEGAEGGVALRNVLSIMNKEDFLPRRVREQLKGAGVDVKVLSNSSLSLGDRLKELSKIGGNDSLLGGMFGMENTVAISGLLQSQDLLQQYTTDIKAATNAGEEMAAVYGSSYQEQRNRITAFFDDIRLSVLGATGDMLPFLDVGMEGLLTMTSMAPGVMATFEAVKMLGDSTKLASLWTSLQTSVQWDLNAAMDANPIGFLIAGIAAMTIGITYAWRNIEGFRTGIEGLWASAKQVFSNIAGFFEKMLAPVFEAISLFMEGDFSGAASAAGQGLFNLATLPAQAIGAALNGELTNGVAEAYTAGAKEGKASFLADQKKEDSTKTGLAALGWSPAEDLKTGFPSVSGKSNSGGSGLASDTVKGGSGRIQNTNVSIEKLVENITIHVNSGIEAASSIQEQVAEALVASVRDFEATTS